MSLVLKSNKAYTGSKQLINLIDLVTTDADKTDYVSTLYTTDGGDPNTIVNPTIVFDKLKAHRQRVINDGGIVLSLPKTLSAIVLADNNSISNADFFAASASFGAKLTGSIVNKVYALGGYGDITVSGSGVSYSEDAGLHTIGNVSSQVTLSAAQTMTFDNGTILGACTKEALPDSTATHIFAPRLSYIDGGSTVLTNRLHNNRAANSYIEYETASTSVQLSLNSSYYKEYHGVAAVASWATGAEMFQNGVSRSTRADFGKNLSSKAITVSTVLNSSAGRLAEFWAIDSASHSLAQALSVHLDNSL